mmetsp:Transcript_12437/g.24844  ORF Transcript_12437/g.24844 Transcript_12437/m.24844 type:complete len:136 (+) Transcript_12437:129-536(+)
MKLRLFFISPAAVLFSAFSFSGSAAAASIEEEYGPAPSTSEKLEHTRVNRNCSHGKKKHVCGKDGKTYRDKCEARRANVKVAYRGKCKSKHCSNVKKLVCGKDGKTYRDKCEARRANVKVACRGRCKKGRNQLFK